jgi:site-specific DNA-methyltransferase (adenine-specific)
MSEELKPHLITGSSELASELAKEFVGKVSLVVTSPPYHNAISYTSHQVDPSADYRTRENLNYAGEYLEMLGRVWSESWKMLMPGGYLAINVGTVLDSGFQYPLPQDIIYQVVNSADEWKFIRSIHWNKVTAGVKRAGSVIQHRLPGYWYPNIMTEHILVFQKPGNERIPNSGIPSEWLESIWDLAPVPPGQVDHPAPFPEDLPHRLIRMLTMPDEIVLDPFNGSGTTTKAAFDLGRRSIGFDLSREYNAYAEQRLANPTSVRPLQLRVEPIDQTKFEPGKTKGKTRHGSGLGGRKGAKK